MNKIKLNIYSTNKEALRYYNKLKYFKDTKGSKEDFEEKDQPHLRLLLARGQCQKVAKREDDYVHRVYSREQLYLKNLAYPVFKEQGDI